MAACPMNLLRGIIFSCHGRTHNLKKLCSLICKRSLPRFFKIHPHRCLGSSSAWWLCYSSSLSLSVSIYTSSPKHSEKGTTCTASFPSQWPVCVDHRRSGNKMIRLTKLSPLKPQVQMLHSTPANE